MSEGTPLGEMSTPAKVGGAILAGAAPVAILAMIDTRVALIVAVGVLAVGLVLVAYFFTLRWWRRRTGGALGSNAGSGADPGGISRPEDKRTADEMRKAFLEGVKIFESSGNDFYSVPWYVVIGVSGAGKTAAIRNSGLDFAKGITKPYQGIKGTANMHWWFTSKGILLDTAGKVVFPEVKAGDTPEWTEFLGMLRRYRKRCPINGVLLAIAADSLIGDSDATIQENSRAVSDKLTQIQQALKVRCPVYLLVTKCDKVWGFREFFEDMRDPNLTRQILGWSKPGSLDEPFNADEVQQHLQTVRQRLLSRRSAMLLDPVNTINPDDRRLDQVDSLFEFPERLAGLGSRLKLYLELIFSGDQFSLSGKPLFLRGIYFTSALTFGQALDQAVADATGQSVRQLAGSDPDAIEAEGLTEKKPYFIGELFPKKIFPEWGLVTRSNETVTAKTRFRRAVLVSSGILFVVLALGLTIWAKVDLDNAIGNVAGFYKSLNDQYGAKKFGDGSRGWRIVFPRDMNSPLDFDYRGDQEGVLGGDEGGKVVKVGPVTAPLGTLIQSSLEFSDRQVKPPRMFLFRLERDVLEAERWETHVAFAKAVYLQPLMDAAAARMTSDSAEVWKPVAGEWGATGSKTAALAALLQIQHHDAAAGVTNARLLEGLAGFVLDKENFERFKKHSAAMQNAFAATMKRLHDRGGRLGLGKAQTLALERAGAAGLARFCEHWQTQGTAAGGGDSLLARLAALQDAVKAFADAEQRIQKTHKSYSDVEKEPSDRADYDEVVGAWRKEHATLGPLAGKVTAALTAVEERLATLGGAGGKASLTTPDLWDRAVDDHLTTVRAAFEAVRSAVPAPAASSAPAPGSGPAAAATGSAAAAKATLDKLDQTLAAIKEQAAKDVSARRGHFEQTLAQIRENASAQRAFAQRAKAYALADGWLVALDDDAQARVAEKHKTLAGIDAQFEQDATALKALAEGADPGAGATKAAEFTMRLGARAQRALWLKAQFKKMPRGIEEVEKRVADAAADVERLPRVDLPLTGFEGGKAVDLRFHPDAALEALKAFDADRYLVDKGNLFLDRKALRLEYEAKRSALEGYWIAFVKYWLRDVRDLAAVRLPTAWSEVVAKVKPIDPAEVNSALLKLTKQRIKALEGLSLGLLSPEQQKQVKSAIDELHDDVERLADEASERQGARAVRAWTRLGADPFQARDAIRALGSDDFKTQHLPAYGKDLGKYRAAYWSDLTLAMLDALAQAVQGGAGNDLKRLLSDYAFFPLDVNDAGKTLTVDDVREARVILTRLRSASTTKAAGAGKQSEEWSVGIADVDERLKVLWGLSLFAPPQREHLDRMLALAEAILAKETPLTCRVVLLDQTDLGKMHGSLPPAGLKNWYFEVRDAQKARIGARLWCGGNYDRTNAADLKLLPVLPLTGAKLSLVFLKDDKDGPEMSKPVDLGAAWAPLWMLQKRKSEYRRDQGAWAVPLEVEANDGSRLSYVLGLWFDRDLPPLEQWPDKQGAGKRASGN